MTHRGMSKRVLSGAVAVPVGQLRIYCLAMISIWNSSSQSMMNWKIPMMRFGQRDPLAEDAAAVVASRSIPPREVYQKMKMLLRTRSTS